MIMKALLIIDLQNDFLPGGALAVKDGNQVVPFISKLVNHDFDYVVASKDWHPENHGSFAETHGRNVGEHIQLKGMDQILWPTHCVQGSWGAEFSDKLDVNKIDKVFLKGTEKDIDSYSAFFDNGHHRSTGLEDFLKSKGVTDIYFVGLATDYCVKFSLLDAAQLGFKTYLVLDACKPVNLKEGDETQAIAEMKKVGAKITTTEEVLSR